MADPLSGLSILVLEDEFYLADDLAFALASEGARVLGPFGRVIDAQALIDRGEPIDLALLDINLMGDKVFPLAEALRRMGTPFVFATGYDVEIIPQTLRDAPRLEKPFTAPAMIQLLLSMI